MIVDGRNSTKWAIIFVILGVLMLVGVPFLLSHEGEDLRKFWLGVAIATVLLLLFFRHSYNIGIRKLTAKEKQNAVKVADGAKGAWVWAVIGVMAPTILWQVFGWELPDSVYPTLAGGFSALLLLMGVAVLLDNFLLRAIFMWNNSDPQIRKLWRGK